jgi:hypothetical protein
VNWLNVGEGKKLKCPSCSATLSEFLLACDHHPTPCVACKETLVVLSTMTRTIAIALDKAPLELRYFLQWSVQNLEELEFTSLLIAMDDMFGEKGPKVASPPRPLSFGRARPLPQPTLFPATKANVRTAG